MNIDSESKTNPASCHPLLREGSWLIMLLKDPSSLTSGSIVALLTPFALLVSPASSTPPISVTGGGVVLELLRMTLCGA
jgi:hypothetical protein